MRFRLPFRLVVHCLEIYFGIFNVHDNLRPCEQAVHFFKGEVPGLGIWARCQLWFQTTMREDLQKK